MESIYLLTVVAGLIRAFERVNAANEFILIWSNYILTLFTLHQ